MPPDSALIEATKDCPGFRKKNEYPTNPGSEEEASFPIAYSIVFHRDLAQVERVLRAIYQPQNFYCFHVDAKASRTLHKAAEALVSCFDNVFIATKLERVVYAGVSRLQADINCMHDLQNISASWRYVINLVGQMFPLKTNRELVNVLKIYNGANDVEGLPVWRRIRTRYEKRWDEVFHVDGTSKVENNNGTNPPLPHYLTLVRGSAFGVFSRGFIEFVLTNEKAKDLLEWSRHTYSPDEHYWATLHHVYVNPNLNSPGGYDGLPDRKPWMAAYASWYPRDPCKGKIVRGVCVFGVKDLPQLSERRELFANKFYLDYQYLTMECLQEWLQNRSASYLPASYEFYRNLPFVIRKKWIAGLVKKRRNSSALAMELRL